MKKNIFIFIIFILFLNCNSLKNEHKKFTLEKFCNEWLYINSYEGIVTKIDTLNKEVKKYKYYTPSLTFRKDGTYRNYQGDYQDNGKYTFEEKSGVIKKFYNMGSTKVENVSRLTYLDNEYMLMVVFENDKESTGTFFYKKK
jgi:hypothetical protein